MQLVSIIVPVYNVEKYIVECLESVINQTYTQWELLLIDDGSTDHSGKICDDYAVIENRIKVIHKANTGVSDTRNIGIDMAKGEFIIFLDADDYWSNLTILQELVSVAETHNADIVRGEYKNVDVLGNNIQESRYVQSRVSYISKLLDSLVFLSQVVKGEYFLVLCLIRRGVIEHIRFNTERVFLEDAEFYQKMLLQSLRCVYVPICFYAYRKHNESITVKVHPQKFFDALNYTRFCFNLATQKNNTKERCLYLVNEGIKNYLFDIKVVSETDRTNKEYNEVIQKYDLYNRRLEVIKNAHHYPIFIKYYLCFLPLKILIYYYRVFFDSKKLLSYIYHKILRK